MYDSKFYNQKINLVTTFYNKICVQDRNCLQLKRNFMQAFYTFNRSNDDINYLNIDTKSIKLFERFHQIYSLIYGICGRLHTNAIHSIWIICCQTVLDDWTNQLHRYSSVDQLDYILQCWNQYQNGNNFINSLTLYAQNKLFQSHKTTRIKSQINEICCHIFVEQFFVKHSTLTNVQSGQKLEKSIFNTIFQVINQVNPVNNLNDQVRFKCVETVKNMLRLLQFVDSRSQIVYYRIFAFPYLEVLQRQYRRRSQIEIVSFDGRIIDYLKYVELAMDEQIGLANQYSFTLPFVRMIAKILYNELITQHQSNICNYNSFRQLIISDNWNQLNYLYNMIVYNSDAVKLLAANLETYLKNQLNAIQLINWKTTRYTHQGASNFVESCNQLMDHWDNAIKITFSNDPIIIQSINSSFSHYLNSNPVYISIIALYVHIWSLENCELLVTRHYDYSENGKSQRNIMIANAFKLLAFIDDKSALIQFNHHFICHRILYDLSYSIENDLITISSKLESLNVDIPFNLKLLLKDFNSSIQLLNKSIDFNITNFEVKLLNSSLWNLEKSPTSFRLPKMFLNWFNLFRTKYRSKNPKKSVILNQNYGTAVIEAYFEKNNSGTFYFEMTLRQTAILFVFNKFEQISFKQIATLTRMDDESLIQCIKTFQRYNLIMIVNSVLNDYTLIDNDYWTKCTFQINDNFQFNGGNFSTESRPISWVKLQFESTDYNLEQIMQKCYRNVAEICGGSTQSNGAPSATVEANQSGKNVRLEAAVIRTMKKEKVVLDLNLLHKLVLETIGNRPISSPSPQKDRSASVVTNKKFVLSFNELKQIVISLEKRGYIRVLDNETILYEP